MSPPPAPKNRSVRYPIAAGLALLLCLVLALSAVLLKKGLHSDGFRLGPASISGVSLQWQDKLLLHIDDLAVELSQDGRQWQFPQGLDFVDTGLRVVRGIDLLFQHISIKRLRVGELSGRVRYGADGFFVEITARDLSLRSRLKIEGKELTLDIVEAVSETMHSRGTGQVRLNLGERQASGSLTVNLAGSLPLLLDFSADGEQVSFHGREADVISGFTPFVDLFGLSPNIQRWITEYLTGSRYELKAFRGSFPWDDPLQLLHRFYAEVRVEECEYTFAPGLEAIKTDYTDVVFQQGVLAITPHDSSFYGQAGEDSWLDIDFNDPDNIILTAYILTHAVANRDILRLLQYYGISLPFIQTAGRTDTDLTLAINLNNEELTAHGRFRLEDGEIEYEEKTYGVKDGVVNLENTVIGLENLRLSFGGLFAADISGTVDLAKETGDLDIEVHEFAARVGSSRLSIDPARPKPTLQYRIRPQGVTIAAAASSWKLGVLPLRLGGFSMPFSFADLSGVLPPTRLSLPDRLEAVLSGPFAVKGQQVDFRCDLQRYNVKDLVLEQGHLPLRLHYDGELTIRTLELSQWSLNHIPIGVHPSILMYGDNVISILDSRISYGSFFDSYVTGYYNFQENQGNFVLDNLQIRNEDIGDFLSPGETVALTVDGRGESLLVKVSKLGMEISSGGEKGGWSAAISDLGALHRHSKLLQRYMLDSGSFTVFSVDGEKPYLFSADIPCRYPILVTDDTPLDRLLVNGEINEQGGRATVNRKLNLAYDGELSITSRDIGYNIPAILKFMKERPQPAAPDPEKKEGLRVNLVATNSSLYLSPDSQAPAERISLQSADETFSLQLEHGAGAINVDVEGGKFSLLGNNLNDVFMNRLSPDARLRGGSMSAAAHGSFNEFSALLTVNDTVLSDYKTLNNVLAFVNTIPALITFSLPEYDTRGLPVTSAVAGMKVKDGLVSFESLDVDSPELGMAGTGWIDLPGKRIEMALNLITQSKVNVGKIPLIGYILAGEEKQPSITVKVTGDLLNPEVESQMFREVVTVPFSILYRTLSLPSHLVSPMLESDWGEGEDGEDEISWEGDEQTGDE